MTKGDKYQDIQQINAGSYLAIQPNAGVEVVIHTISHADAIEVYYTDGTLTIGPIETRTTGPGAITGLRLHCSNGGAWYTIKNIAATTKEIGYDGVQTK